jgi:hypothetical protein
MSEQAPDAVRHALKVRGLSFLFPAAQKANLQEKRIHAGAKMREAVFGMFEGLTGMQYGINWAIFEVPPKNELENDEGDRMDREILVIVDRRDPAAIPTIRIISNELFQVGDMVNYLTEDFTLDHEHDAHYYADATEIREGGGEDPDSISPIFFVLDDVLFVTNYEDFTASYGIDAEPTDSVEFVNPFGFTTSELDQLDALATARGLLSETAYITPTSYGVQPDMPQTC